LIQLKNDIWNFPIQHGNWTFSDVRVNIEPGSFGSDAANPHTQYSNAVAKLHSQDFIGRGFCFTLGEGNQYICEASDFVIKELDGYSLGDILDSPKGFWETLANPRQLRWLSPYSGIPLMSAGLIVNTILDALASKHSVPTWKLLSLLDPETLLSFLPLRHLSPDVRAFAHHTLTESFQRIDSRIREIETQTLPVYFTTWIGHSASQIVEQILSEKRQRGISIFKVKIGPNFDSDVIKLREIIAGAGEGISIAVDANQTLSYGEAVRWIRVLSDLGVLWLEEPFAPDNSVLFSKLRELAASERLSCEISSGENCPNAQTAESLMATGLHRFQPDPCRMMGLFDGVLTAVMAKKFELSYTPHAGGAGLDELSPHLQLFNLARVDTDSSVSATLTETIGFCSGLYERPVHVRNGGAVIPIRPGSGVAFRPDIEENLLDYREGVTWLEL
jgi:L-alanine-DL-glutamate epimerase-like enolase superfamily enzyme